MYIYHVCMYYFVDVGVSTSSNLHFSCFHVPFASCKLIGVKMYFDKNIKFHRTRRLARLLSGFDWSGSCTTGFGVGFCLFDFNTHRCTLIGIRE